MICISCETTFHIHEQLTNEIMLFADDDDGDVDEYQEEACVCHNVK
jgi:hypothetical protein